MNQERGYATMEEIKDEETRARIRELEEMFRIRITNRRTARIYLDNPLPAEVLDGLREIYEPYGIRVSSDGEYSKHPCVSLICDREENTTARNLNLLYRKFTRQEIQQKIKLELS